LLQHPPIDLHMLARKAPVGQRVILRVTNESPRRGDSWLNTMPLQAYMP
jgi:hypothetical protein